MLQVSASQLKTFKRCPRAWWFERVLDLPQGDGSYGMVWGTVLHGVIERYLGADASGRGPDGKEVELYPLGWQYSYQHAERIKEEDEAPLKALIERAIERGILERLPNTKVEWYFHVTMLDAWDDHMVRPRVFCNGYVDVVRFNERRIEDHKGVKDARYQLSAEALAEDLQLNLYAKILLEHYRTQGEPDAPITIQHNYYDRVDWERKTTPKKLPVVRTPEQIDAHWSACLGYASHMLEVAEAELPEHRWRDAPAALDGAGDGPKACLDYGGCKFHGICTNDESIDDYRRRHLRLRFPEIKLPGVDMSSFANKFKPGPAPAPAPKPAEPASAPINPPDDWGGCVACNNTGKNSRGGYCVCEHGSALLNADREKNNTGAGAPPAASAPGGQPSEPTAAPGAGDPDKCDVCGEGPDTVHAHDDATAPGGEGGRAGGGTAPAAPAADPAAGEPASPTARMAELKKLKKDELVLRVLELESMRGAKAETVDTPQGEVTAVTPKGGLNRQIVILHNAAIESITDGDWHVATISQALVCLIREIAGDVPETYYKKDGFKRRDLVKELAPKLLEHYRKQVPDRGLLLLATPMSADERDLLAALRPFADVEFAGRS
jgi:hypothetical protein